MPRNINTITASLFSNSNLQYWEYLRMDWGGGIGSLRWTTYPTASEAVESHDVFQILDIERTGTAQLWDGTRVWSIGAFEQAENMEVTVSDLSFGNANDEFSDLLQQRAAGIRGIPMTVWIGFFTLATPPIFVDSFLLFDGVGDRAESGDEVHVSLEPFASILNTKFPRRRFTSAFGFDFLPPPDLVINFGPLVIKPQPASKAQTGAEPPQDAPGATTARLPIVRIGARPGRTRVVRR